MPTLRKARAKRTVAARGQAQVAASLSQWPFPLTGQHSFEVGDIIKINAFLTLNMGWAPRPGIITHRFDPNHVTVCPVVSRPGTSCVRVGTMRPTDGWSILCAVNSLDNNPSYILLQASETLKDNIKCPSNPSLNWITPLFFADGRKKKLDPAQLSKLQEYWCESRCPAGNSSGAEAEGGTAETVKHKFPSTGVHQVTVAPAARQVPSPSGSQTTLSGTVQLTQARPTQPRTAQHKLNQRGPWGQDHYTLTELVEKCLAIQETVFRGKQKCETELAPIVVEKKPSQIGKPLTYDFYDDVPTPLGSPFRRRTKL